MRHLPGTIIIPSGRCPFLLEGTDPKSVASWVKKINDNVSSGVHYAPSALRYWIRHTYDVNSTKHGDAVEAFDGLLGTDN